MVKADKPEILRALTHLRDNPDFQVVTAWIVDQAIAISVASVAMRDEVTCRWYQGGAQALKEINDVVRDSRDRLIKLEQQEERKHAK